MDVIKKYKVVIAVITTVLVVVVIRLISFNHFRDDAAKRANPSALKTNIITVEKSWSLGDGMLLISLDDTIPSNLKSCKKSFKITADSILDRVNLKTVLNNKGPVLLFSSDIAVSSRIWMLLSQMGCKNLYILTNEPDNEVQKHNFRPDTLSRPEV
jgi:hypothetical protein